MKLNPVIFLLSGFAVSAGGPLYAADGTPDAAQKNYQKALGDCEKKTGSAKSKCMNSVAEEKCKGLSGTEKSACINDAISRRPDSSGDSQGRPVDRPSEQPMAPPGDSPGGSYRR